MIILVTGGARSGKSTFAENIFRDKKDVVYIATALVSDEEMEQRINLHRQRRPYNWRTFEGYKSLNKAVENEENYLLDCITNMVSNIMFENTYSEEKISEEIKKEVEDKVINEIKLLIDEIRKKQGNLVMVTNEVGDSIVPENHVARAFRDIQGRVNARLGSLSDEVYLVVCGQPLKIK
ncbi:MAG: bifunctional adenosylcobinamide kinase/adenosylcobinamide-phosphate guanylyltransferase [Clostridiales bacterium]|nr:bifunctional adenosylcobinamide kinase/adenosylcobinamide-phosphate guanylyltransferase [Clostridiales bacterium]